LSIIPESADEYFNVEGEDDDSNEEIRVEQKTNTASMMGDEAFTASQRAEETDSK